MSKSRSFAAHGSKLSAYLSPLRRKPGILVWLLAFCGGLPALGAGGVVQGWGLSNYGQADAPSGLTNVVAVACGLIHSVALKADGTVTAWGYNGDGQTNVPPGLSNVVAIAAESQTSLALRSDGTVVAWGYNGNGQTDVPAALSNVVAIAAGDYFNLALQSNGIVVAWGSQTNVPAGLSNVVGLAAGSASSLALTSDGTVVGWGGNLLGETNVPAGLSNVVAISAGGYNGAALRSDGTVVEWGNNTYGETNVPVGLSNVVAISVGDLHSLALKSDGTIVAWGNNDQNRSTNPFGLQRVMAIAAGGAHSLVVNDGTPCLLQWPGDQSILAGMSVSFTNSALGPAPLTYRWQFNGSDLTGTAAASLVLTNVQLTNVGSYRVVVSSSYGAITSPAASLNVLAAAPTLVQQPASVATWLGGSSAFSLSVTGSPPFTFQWRLNGTNTATATGWALTNALVLCNVQTPQFGRYDVVVSNPYGSVTSQPASLSFSQVAAWGSLSNLPPAFTNLVAIANSPAVLHSDGTAADWMYLNSVRTISGLSNAVALSGSLNGSSGLALLSNGRVLRWQFGGVSSLATPGLTNIVAVANYNYNDLELRADGTLAGGALAGAPAQIVSLSGVVAVAEGTTHSMALKSDGTVAAWGSNTYGQTNVPVGLSNVVAITAGGYCSLALRADGTLVGWGRNTYGETNVPPGLSNVVAVAAGESHVLALKADGTVVAWGQSFHGETNVPSGLSNVIAIAAGAHESLALVGTAPPPMQVPVSSLTFGSNTVSLILPSQSGRVFELDYRNSLGGGSWTALPLVPGTGKSLTLTDPSATAAQRVYRVRRW